MVPRNSTAVDVHMMLCTYIDKSSTDHVQIMFLLDDTAVYEISRTD